MLQVLQMVLPYPRKYLLLRSSLRIKGSAIMAIAPNSSFFSFDLKSFYFACVRNRASLFKRANQASACRLSVSAISVEGRVVSQDVIFPGNSAMDVVLLDASFQNLTSVVFELDGQEIALLDSVRYTLKSLVSP